MKFLAVFFAGMIVLTGTVFAAPRSWSLHSKLDLPIYNAGAPNSLTRENADLYIGSDKSYAAAPKEVRVVGRSVNVGLAVAGLLQPLGLFAAAGFFIVGAYNAMALVSTLNEKPAPKSEWTILGHKKQKG